MDDDRSKQVSRRTALRVWLAGASSLTLLAAAGGLSAGAAARRAGSRTGRCHPGHVRDDP